jgi:alanine dehydrogenase
MIIGIPKEIKNNENRVSLTPGGVMEMVKHGHKVYVQSTAGVASDISDEAYIKAGAEILPDIESVYAVAEMIIKVKEPIKQEYKLIRENQVVFTYFHFASNEELTKAMIDSKAICIAYETVKKSDGSLPLLIPMSEVAGRMAIQQGARFLEKPAKGRGVLLGGVPGVAPGKVLVIGGGIVGANAARMAAGLGAQVTILDKNLDRLRYLSDVMPSNVVTQFSSEYNIRELVKTHDLIIGAVLIPGAKAPKLVSRDMIATMRAGTVIVDVAIDQGGSFETSRPTTHEDPTFLVDDVVHYCVTNMPGAVPHTSTIALTNATLPYALLLANMGWKKACSEHNDLRSGLNIINGNIVFSGVAEAFKLPISQIDNFIK